MIIGFHYEAIVDILGYCPIPVVCGINRLGKTKSERAALSLIGNTGSFYSLAKDRFFVPGQLCLLSLTASGKQSRLRISQWRFTIGGRMGHALSKALPELVQS